MTVLEGRVNFRAPALPIAPKNYDPKYFNQLNNVLRIYFNQLDTTITALITELGIGLETGYVQFDMDNPGARAMGRLRWNATDGTLDLGMGFTGVYNQLGQETYFPPLYNNTGSMVEDGTLIGVVGYNAGGGGLTFVKFLADGSMNSIQAIALVTSDMANGARGLGTRSGYVRGLDTTGAVYGETWVVNQVLYASPTVAGGLTNVEPIAPSLAYSVGIVTVVDATEGVILVVTSDLKEPVYYGAFSDSTTQSLVAVNTPQTVTFNSTDASSGVTIGSPTSRIVIANPGVYNFQFSTQLESSVAASRLISIWPRINGTDVPNSATNITIKNNSDVIVPAWNFVLPMEANDYFELVWAADGNSVSLSSHAAQAVPYVRPAIPSVILTVSQVNQ